MAHTTGKVRVYGQLSQSFDTSSGVRQGCPISPFLFNFVMDEVMHNALAEHETVGVDLVMGERLCDLEYADDVYVPFRYCGKCTAYFGQTCESFNSIRYVLFTFKV